MIVLWIILFVVSLYVLIKSADYFTEYSEKLGLLFGMSSFIIGATIVSIGTSLPELFSSLFAVGKGFTEFVSDNIVGSNIANALLILGIGAVVARKLTVDTSLIDVDLPFFFTSMAVFVFFAYDKVISWPEGILLLILFIAFLIYSVKAKPEPRDVDEMRGLGDQYRNSRNILLTFKYLGIVILSALFLTFSAKFLIESLLNISELLHISSSLLAITVVALGTSLPELMASISAIKVGNHGMVIGNVFGSNIFNLLLVGGLPAIFKNLNIDESTFIIGLPFLVIATFVAIFITLDNKIQFWEGAAMLFLYLVFLVKIIGII